MKRAGSRVSRDVQSALETAAPEILTYVANESRYSELRRGVNKAISGKLKHKSKARVNNTMMMMTLRGVANDTSM